MSTLTAVNVDRGCNPELDFCLIRKQITTQQETANIYQDQTRAGEANKHVAAVTLEHSINIFVIVD